MNLKRFGLSIGAVLLAAVAGLFILDRTGILVFDPQYLWPSQSTPAAQPAAVPVVDRKAAAESAAKTVYEKQEADLAVIDQQQWGTLPTWVQDVYISPTGRVVFIPNTGDDDDATLKESLQKVCAGKSQIIRRNILLIDKNGSAWAQGPSNSIVECVGGQISERKDVRARVAFEDSQGNNWFFGDTRPTEYAANRRTTDGVWSTLAFPAKGDDALPSLDRSTLFEQPGGVLDLCAYHDDSSRKDDPNRAAHVDQFVPSVGAWRRFIPRVCTDHQITAIYPVEDNSFVVTCEGPHLWIYHAPDENYLQPLLGRLESAEQAQRDAASRGILELGPAWTDVVKKVLSQNPSAETEQRLQEILKTWSTGELKEPLGEPQDLTAQLRIGWFSVVAADQRNGLILYARDVDDRTAGKKYAQALLHYNHGSWEVRPVQTAVDIYGSNSLIDSAGRIWLPTQQRIELDGSVTNPYPPTVKGVSFIGQDAQGRIYFRGSPGIIVYNENAHEGGPPLPHQNFVIRGPVAQAIDGAIWAWLANEDGQQLSRFVHGKWEVVPQSPMGYGRGLIALEKGAMVVTSSQSDYPAALYVDGKWIGARDLPDLIATHYSDLLPLLPRHFTPSPGPRLARDAYDRIWGMRIGMLYQYGLNIDGNGTPQNSGYFCCFDGKQWRDLDDDLAQKRVHTEGMPTGVGAALTMFDDGKSVLFRNSQGAGHVLSLKDELFHFDDLKLANPDAKAPEFMMEEAAPLSLPDGTLLSQNRNDQSRVMRIGPDVRLELMRQTGAPFFTDAQRRVWSIGFDAPKPLRISGADDVGNIKSTLDSDINFFTVRALQTRAGRVFLSDAAGFREAVVAPGDKLSWGAKWRWPTPRSKAWGMFEDDGGGVWVYDNTHSLTRVLPDQSPAQVSPAASLLPANRAAVSVMTPAPLSASALKELRAATKLNLRDVEEHKQFLAHVASASAEFPQIELTDRLPLRWQTIKLNRQGSQLDAVRIKAPPGQNLMLHFAFSTPKDGIESWYLQPSAEDSHERFTIGPAADTFGKGASPQEILVTQEWSQLLEANREYILWFKFKDVSPVDLKIIAHVGPFDDGRRDLLGTYQNADDDY
jgi:hypothetical protein